MNTYYFFHGTLRIPGNPLPIYGVTRADSAIPPDEIYEKLVEQEATSRGLPIISIEIDTFNVVGMWKEPASIPPPPPPVQTEEKVDLKLPVVEPDKMERDQTYKK